MLREAHKFQSDANIPVAVPCPRLAKFLNIASKQRCEQRTRAGSRKKMAMCFKKTILGRPAARRNGRARADCGVQAAANVMTVATVCLATASPVALPFVLARVVRSLVHCSTARRTQR